MKIADWLKARRSAADERKSLRSFAFSCVAILLGLLAGMILMAAIGSNPFKGIYYLFSGGLMSVEKIGNTLATAVPLVFTGLAVAFAFRTGLFNIGAAGQMLIGGLGATWVALCLPWPKWAVIPVMFIAAAAGGGLCAAIPGLLKAYFNVHEVVSTIMMNWIMFWAVDRVVPVFFAGSLETESRLIPDTASLKVGWLTNLFNGSSINLGIFFAIGAIILIAFILNRTTLGYELKAVGFNRNSAEYAGMPVKRNIALSMVISGALAGLAGLAFYTGNASNIQIGTMPSQGYDGIAVALLGVNTPWGAAAAALFFGIMQSGKAFMSAMTNVPDEIANTIIAVIIYFAATIVLIERLWDWIKRKRAAKTNPSGEAQHVAGD